MNTVDKASEIVKSFHTAYPHVLSTHHYGLLDLAIRTWLEHPPADLDATINSWCVENRLAQFSDVQRNAEPDPISKNRGIHDHLTIVVKDAHVAMSLV